MKRIWVGLFYLFFIGIIMGHRFKNAAMMFVSNSFFLIFALMSLIAFFSTYVYELPTHRCPFCLLQKEYYYVGYVLYVFLFAGTFYGTSGAVMELLTKQSQHAYYRRSLVFNGLYVMMISFYPVSYFLKNGVWL